MLLPPHLNKLTGEDKDALEKAFCHSGSDIAWINWRREAIANKDGLHDEPMGDVRHGASVRFYVPIVTVRLKDLSSGLTTISKSNADSNPHGLPSYASQVFEHSEGSFSKVTCELK